MARVLYINNFVNGVLADASAVVLSDIAGTFGIKETVSGDVVVAADTAVVNESTGVYTYDISDLETETAYTAVFKISRSNGDTEYEQVLIPVITYVEEGKYATIDDANNYFAGRLNTEDWDEATSVNQDKALIQSTRIIDRLNILGIKASTSQTLQFPRDSDTTVPQDIKDATCEIALALLQGIDPELEFENLDVVSQGFGAVKNTYGRATTKEHISAGVPSSVAWRYLKPYLRDVRTITIARVS